MTLPLPPHGFEAVDQETDVQALVDCLDVQAGDPFHQAVTQQVFSLLTVHSRARILDVGCGTGADARLLAQLVAPDWSEFLVILTDRAVRAGHEVIRVPARFTTQNCRRCRAYVHKSLSVRTHICPSCGLIEDRDVNAARNILQAGASPSGTVGRWAAG